MKLFLVLLTTSFVLGQSNAFKTDSIIKLETEKQLDQKIRSSKFSTKEKVRIIDSVIAFYDSFSNNPNAKIIFTLDKSKNRIGSLYLRKRNNYVIGNSVTFKDVLRFLNYNTILTFVPKELQYQYFFIYYNGNIEEPKNKIDFEDQILHHLHLNKKVKKEYFYSYTLFPNVATLFKSFKREYRQVYNPKEQKVYASCRLNQLANLLNCYFPEQFILDDNTENETFYDFEIDLSTIENTIKELEFLGFIVSENKALKEYTYFSIKD